MGIGGLAVVALLLAQANGEMSRDDWGRYQFQRELNECAVAMLVAQARNGGLAVDSKGGHGVTVDRILEECRKALGAAQE